MSGLTVTEKEHWKDRINRRIDKKIEVISAEDPNLFDNEPQSAAGPAPVTRAGRRLVA